MAESEIVPPEQAVESAAAVDDAKRNSTDAQPTSPLQEEQQEPGTSPSEASPDPEAFVNNGLEKWLAAREAWCRKPDSASDDYETKHNNSSDDDDDDDMRHAIPVDVDGIIDVLFDPRWRGGGGRVKVSLEPPRFPKNVPLPQMIDVLTDLWEAEGLDV